MIWTCANLWPLPFREGWRGTSRGGFLLLLLLFTGCHRAVPLPDAVAGSVPAPPAAALYTAVGAIHALVSGPDGTLWAATAGGVVCWRPGQPPVRWTAADGLTGSEVRVVEPTGVGALAATETGLAQLTVPGQINAERAPASQELRCLLTRREGTQWLGTSQGVYVRKNHVWRLRFPGEAWRMASERTQSWAITAAGLRRLGDGKLFPLPVARENLGPVTAFAAESGGVYLATALGLWQWENGRWHALSLPDGSPASHVSALSVQGKILYAGLYGDGVYQWQAGLWRRLPNQPLALGRVTALAPIPGGVAVGTRADGVWDWTNGKWKARALPNALPSGDIYTLATYRGALWAGTFDSGLLRIDSQGQKVVTRADGLRADAPRVLTVFGDCLYVRHTTGQVDCTSDGQTWRPAFTHRELPRSLVSALATDGQRLYVGGWASWSAWDGQRWEHHDKDPELAGQVVTAIAARPGEVWIGTQKQGLFRYASGRYTHFFEVQGLTDDWITCLCVTPVRVLVGTYTGGLLEWNGRGFAVRMRPKTYAVRAVCLRPRDRCALAATPLGVFQEDASGWHLLALKRCGGSETQALLPLPSGLWIGSRTGLAYWPEPK